MKHKLTLRLIAACTFTLLSTFVFSEQIEIIQSADANYHATANHYLEQTLQQQGHTLIQKVLDEDIDSLELNSRTFHGQAPFAARIGNLDYQQWARLGFLANFNELAKSETWDNLLPTAVADISKYNDKYISIPVSLTKTNVLWANTSLFKKLRLTPPRTWAEFDSTSAAIAKAGYDVIKPLDDKIALAQLFESLALSIGGTEYYKSIFIDYEILVFNSETTDQVFERFYKLINLMKLEEMRGSTSGSNAVFRFGEQHDLGSAQSTLPNANTDYMCLDVPGLKDKFIFDAENFVFFNMPNIHEKVMAQESLARIVMSDEYQLILNRSIGSIPARLDSSMRDYSPCAKLIMSELIRANNANDVIPSVANGIATTHSVQTSYIDKIYELAFAPKSPRESTKALSKAIRLGNYLLK